MAQINVRIDDDLKKESTKILDSIGLDLNGAVKMFLKQVVLQEGILFKVSLKRSQIIQALQDIDEGRVKQFDDIECLMEDLTDED
ncbi:type II toxin-antitoxin system RelB/DinJ family antitoxin [Ruoffia tabacinasalis]|uniref:Type II toxin-antitoxin system RelB/DinJ family antitoxin n=1 Tax=Ruoffia tabacinasalis TaxID=87458 RepID=A0A5R9DTE8_9LACT|nr:type II toxin-antitoxin system RelB/DinJ family antitoxin [Ruoffia tabacinasalis]TLQ40208.1 type II toxin-antitoxin system RelB/DinJ family antitoxin [Ruoffia tabacinasalis]